MNTSRPEKYLSAGSKAPAFWLLLCAVGLMCFGFSAFAAEPGPQPERWKKRWVYVSKNLYVNENMPKIEALFTRVKKAGYTSVLFTDFKTGTWWKLENADRWAKNARRVREICTELGLELHVCVTAFGYSGNLLFHDPNLANGMPVKDSPMIAKGGELLPEPTATLKNGSFEERNGDKALGFSFQDGVGKFSKLDTETKKDGKVALHFAEAGGSNARIFQKVKLKPWTQYRVRVWTKTEKLTGGDLRIMALANGRTLQWQYLSFPRPNGKGRMMVNGPRDLTTDWFEQSVTFNSLDNEEVGLYLGQWGAQSGDIWWDDCRIDDAPLMNLLRRERLPLKVVGEDGTEFVEGKDFEPVVDPGMGSKPWSGSYDTHHEPPVIKLTKNSRIKDGQKVKLSCYHATLVMHAQVNMSMDDPKAFEVCAEEVRHAKATLNPDGWFMSHDEIRCAAWEPGQQEKFKTTGALFAHNVKQCYDLVMKEGGGKPVQVWSDMYDPHHNAHKNFYIVQGDIAGSWEGLDKNITIMKWMGGPKGRKGMEHFAGRGHRQMIAAYYDIAPLKDRDQWFNTAAGIEHVDGVMYTTWRGDYSNLEKFAELWWGGAAGK